MVVIVQKDDPVLRKIAKPIAVKDIVSAETKKVITDMKKALALQKDGVAIAAPQIGKSVRIFIVAGKVFDRDFESEDYTHDPKTGHPDVVYINPVIVKASKKSEWKEGEGCLSCRWSYGEVKRHLNVTIEAYDEHGNKNTRGAGGLLAHIFQHEIDHLDGILFIDKARNLHELPPEHETRKKHAK